MTLQFGAIGLRPRDVGRGDGFDERAGGRGRWRHGDRCGRLRVGNPQFIDTPPRVTSTTNAVPSTSTARPPQQSIVVPDLVGLTWPDAERLLRGVGWSGTIVKMPNATGAEQSSGGIATQDPAPGTSISADSPITLQFNG